MYKQHVIDKKTKRESCPDIYKDEPLGELSLIPSRIECEYLILTLMMTSVQFVETSVNVTLNSPSQDYTHPEYRNLPTYQDLCYHSWVQTIYSISSYNKMTIPMKFISILIYHTEYYNKAYKYFFFALIQIRLDACS